MDTLYMVFQQAMFFTIPLLLVALGGMFSERSGVINIALEGIMIMGAFTSILFISLTSGKISGQLQLILAILIAAGTGVIFSLFHAFAAINMKADQTISGTALNMFGTGVRYFRCKTYYRNPADPVHQHIPYCIRTGAWRYSGDRQSVF